MFSGRLPVLGGLMKNMTKNTPCQRNFFVLSLPCTYMYGGERKMDEQQHVDFDLGQDDPFNPKKDKSVWIKRIGWGVFAIALIVYYIWVTR